MPSLTWELTSFNQLTLTKLYNYLALRSEVFIVEQNCPYQDLDGMDERSMHLIAYDGELPVACARLFAPGDCYTEACIGRVITKPSHRSLKIGHELMKRAIAFCEQEYDHSLILISAQAYLEKFYESHGFLRVSDIYLEDNIPHIKMLREQSRK
ncbi:MAG: GNAT family N-acetyltransferase [Bacteroidota bacterium]